MPNDLDPDLAERIVSSAMNGLRFSHENKIFCTRDDLRIAFLAAAREAYEAGFLKGQQERLDEMTQPGRPTRPAWMDIPLDEAQLAKYGIRLRPVVVKSLLDAGYHCLGDVRWIPAPVLKRLYYVGIKTAREIRFVIDRFDHDR